jgi:hypothetical protein
MNKKEEARRILDRLMVLRSHENISAGSFAYLYAALGDKDKAFYWLNESITEHSVTALEFNKDHSLDPLRSDSRFAWPDIKTEDRKVSGHGEAGRCFLVIRGSLSPVLWQSERRADVPGNHMRKADQP